ncbi:ATP-dependent DNA ligase [Phenylobacterium immobile]|uniref:ATP-dependent DNA ligase n=1 Tax=Phenylobacterium immobile TaxID=21 RepID=UPI000A44DAA6|nr:ATP-dependent DNA ligase [Phenylobacterium immobile]
MPSLADLPVPLDLAPMEAKRIAALPADPGWWFEPKWDGFRCLAYRAGGEVELKAKSGKSLTRFFPEVAARLAQTAPQRFVLDGELVIPVEGRLAFDALQMRLHPAQSRIDKLSIETPADLILFDCLLGPRGAPLLAAPLQSRRAALEDLVDALDLPEHLRLSPSAADIVQARRWLEGSGAETDGVVAKRCDGVYAPGERAMLKIKRLRTADCVVGGFRYLKDQQLVGSLLLGLYDAEGRLNHVGFTSMISDAERPDLTRQLEAVTGGPGFTGDMPGGPSRWRDERSAQWTALKPELVVEVLFDQVTAGRFRHGTRLVRWRPDKAPAQCREDQIAP